MSESLKERLTQHTHAFENLLNLIPAQYYYDEKTKTQWKTKGMRKSDEDKEASKLQRKNKFDPNHGSSALDELKRREQLAENDDDDVVVYDDNGNPISEEKEMSVLELLKLKSIEKLKPGELKLSEGESHAPEVDVEEKEEEVGEKEDVEADEEAPTPSSAHAPTPTPHAPTPAPPTPTPTPTPPSGIEKLRAKLAAKVDELKQQRKAPGTTPNAPKNRAELLAARKLKLEKAKQLVVKPELSESSSENDENDEVKPDQLNLSFGSVKFKDGFQLSKDAKSIEQQRKVKKRNVIDQLKVVEAKKQKLSQLDSEKQNKVSENAKWSRAILQAEGAKVRDDEKLLKKSVKLKENKKKRSEKEWNKRIYQTKKGISDREAKRDANIAAHRDAKKLKLKGKKRKEFMKKAR